MGFPRDIGIAWGARAPSLLPEDLLP